MVEQGKSEHNQALPLRGARVLVVEDEYYIADDVRRILDAAGASVLGPISTPNKAQEALDEGGFDYALIDLNLHGESSIPIAMRLAEEGTPFAIATGYGSAGLPDALKGVPRIEKPFEPPALLKVLEQMSSSKLDEAAG